MRDGLPQAYEVELSLGGGVLVAVLQGEIAKVVGRVSDDTSSVVRSVNLA